MMHKRAFSAAILGLLPLVLIACGGAGIEDIADPTVIPPTAGPSPTATQVAASEIPAVVITSPSPIPTEGDLFLVLVEPAELEVFTDVDSLSVSGRTRVDALVTINDTIVEPGIDGGFSLDMLLEEGPNIIEVVSSVETGEQMDLVLVAVYVP